MKTLAEKMSRSAAYAVVVLTMVAIVSALGPRVADAAPQHLVEGVVVDDKNQPLDQVLVRIYRLVNFDVSRWVTATNTKSDGSYSVQVNDGSPIAIRFDRTAGGGWHPALVSNLSGIQRQSVNPVMHPVGYGHDVDELLEFLSTYERLYFIDRALHPTEVELVRNYRGYIGMLKGWTISRSGGETPYTKCTARGS